MDAERSADINRELLSAYLDDALTEAECAKVEILLRVSEGARQELAEMARVSQMFAAWSPPGPDPLFVRRVDRRIEAEVAQLQKSDAQWWGLQKLATAAMLLICIGSLAFLTQRLNQNIVEPAALDTFLQGSLDSDVREVASLTEDDLSNDRVLDLVFTDNMR
jgi:anti-sigma factor RsiW